jgi:hypothetical protein
LIYRLKNRIARDPSEKDLSIKTKGFSQVDAKEPFQEDVPKTSSLGLWNILFR